MSVSKTLLQFSKLFALCHRHRPVKSAELVSLLVGNMKKENITANIIYQEPPHTFINDLTM